MSSLFELVVFELVVGALAIVSTLALVITVGRRIEKASLAFPAAILVGLAYLLFLGLFLSAIFSLNALTTSIPALGS